jgi:hypothetical protein
MERTVRRSLDGQGKACVLPNTRASTHPGVETLPARQMPVSPNQGSGTAQLRLSPPHKWPQKFQLMKSSLHRLPKSGNNALMWYAILYPLLHILQSNILYQRINVFHHEQHFPLETEIDEPVPSTCPTSFPIITLFSPTDTTIMQPIFFCG